MDVEHHPDDWDSNRQRRLIRREARVPTDPSDARLRIAITVFLGVALIYPWYEYKVDAYLTARDFEAASLEFDRVTEELEQQWANQDARAAESRRSEQQRLRVSRVAVKGVTDGAAGLVVVVDLGSASLAESSSAICRQASVLLKQDLTERSIKVRRYRNNQPALDAGVVNCR